MLTSIKVIKENEPSEEALRELNQFMYEVVQEHLQINCKKLGETK